MSISSINLNMMIIRSVLLTLLTYICCTHAQNEFPSLTQTNIGGLGASPLGGASPNILNNNPFNAGGWENRARGVQDIDWENVDRRSYEDWNHLYGFGEMFSDSDILGSPWNDQQIDLDFFFPYFGFRFNYTFIFPEGFVAFSYPWYIQPPYTFPNPGWPETPDASLIAAFMIDQTPMSVGSKGISYVWYRVISRPPNLIGNTGPGNKNRNQVQGSRNTMGTGFSPSGRITPERIYQGQRLKTQEGRVEDPQLLDQITVDIREGMVGARGFVADYALIVTWERMGYGGAPKVTDLSKFDETMRSQNTYQMVLATDEIRSYTMFNYANINWTSSTSAGAFSGRGGRQSAIVGFNGGNFTGFVQLPYSAEGNSYKLVQFGSTPTAGRWLARVDEAIIYGGCTNESVGTLRVHIGGATMLGGFALNASGPCFRSGNIVKMQIDELTVDCRVINMAIARCVVPVNGIFRIGVVDIKLSVDGGKNYPFWNRFPILTPDIARRRVNLIDDPIDIDNNWLSFEADNLTLRWSAVNITTDRSKTVDITLWGYWEDVEGHRFEEIGGLGRNVPNTGVYSFSPRTLSTTDRLHDAWKKFLGGVVQVRISNDWSNDMGDGLYWSRLIPFGWYHKQQWEYNLGPDWALDLCLEWYDYDGRRDNFIMDLEPTMSCPCTLNQATADFGRFYPLHDCNMVGNGFCGYTQGAQHCVLSTTASWRGAGQMCCYDYQGWLMFSDDFEFNDQYLRFYSAGRPYRAHPLGSFPYKRPPFVPAMSAFYNDLLPYDVCCRWAGHCEFFFWRRQSSGCQEYRPAKLGFAYGDPHFLTYDNTKYTFNGKGYYVLTMMKSPRHDLMVQVRMEQPVKTQWDSEVQATVITGVAASSNGSDVVEVLARKDHRRWRYKTDLYIGGKRTFLDRSVKKIHTFQGVTIYSPDRNMNMSEIDILFSTGVGVKVMESNGMLSVVVSLPPEYNETLADHLKFDYEQQQIADGYQGRERCASYYRTLGLLGVYNDDPNDDFTTPNCDIPVRIDRQDSQSGTISRGIYQQFGQQWKVDGIRHRLLFSAKRKPLYDPQAFANPDFTPIFDVFERSRNRSFYESLIFSYEEVRIACQGSPSCMYDYIMTGRKEIGITTLRTEKSFEAMKRRGEQKLISCGPLFKNRGVLKYPIGDNYLDGTTVSFTCKPEYFLHGTQQRTCTNGTWSPGWWVWCRSRTEENVYKWMTGIIVSLLIIIVLALLFIWCYCMRIKGAKGGRKPIRRSQRLPEENHIETVGVGMGHLPERQRAIVLQPDTTKVHTQQTPSFAAPVSSLPVFDHEPVGMRKISDDYIPGSRHNSHNNYSETAH